MKITVYTITDCPFCKQEKEFLTAQGLQFEEKNVQENRQLLTEMLEVSDKFAGVPFTLIEKDSGEKVALKGFTQSEFEAALGLSAAQPQTAMPTPPATETPSMAEPTEVAPEAAAPSETPDTTASSMPDAAPNMPSMPGIDEAPEAPTQAPSAPVQDAPVEPTQPTQAPANPQNQLDGLLADLQTKSQPDLPDFSTQTPQGTSTQQQ